MKVEHSIEIDGIKATLVFEATLEGLKILHADPKDHASSLDTELSAYQEAFRSIRVPEKAQHALLLAHSELYQNLVNASLELLTKKL